MKMMRLCCLVATLYLPMLAARAEPPRRGVQVGDIYEITKIRDSSSQDGDAASGTSHDKDTLIERIEAVRLDGLEVVFDLPMQATAQERQQMWQFPARVFKSREGQMQLLNVSELEKRVDAWLTAGKMTREACGHWIFTWNAFRIECDPQSVIETIRAFDPEVPDLRARAPYQDAHALGSVPLTVRSSNSDGSILTALLAIDPKAVQRDRAQADVVIGEITRKPIKLDAALVQRAKEAVSGTIEVTIDADTAGNVRRLSKVTRSQTKRPDGSVQTDTVTETLERRLISPRNP